MSRTVNSTRSETVARVSKGVRQKMGAVTSVVWSVAGSMRWIELPTRVHTVRGLFVCPFSIGLGRI